MGLVNAGTYLYFSTPNSASEAIVLEDLSVIEDNFFYYDYFVVDEPQTSDVIMLKDTTGNVLYTANRFVHVNLLPISGQESTIEIYREDALMFRRELRFCNNNNVCEPCEGGNCNLIENSLTCNDCASGSKDFFCDLIEDGICDIDCDNHDPDCAGCENSDIGCLYHDQDTLLLCERNFRGKICAIGESCDGDIRVTDDTDQCCIGSCEPFYHPHEGLEEPEPDLNYTGGSDFEGLPEEESADPILLFEQNFNDSIPVEYETDKIWCSDVGKTACEYFEECTGERVYSDDEGYDCCTGECTPLSKDEFEDRYKDIYGEDYIEELDTSLPENKSFEEVIIEKRKEKTNLLFALIVIAAVIALLIVFIFYEKRLKEREKRLNYEYNYYKKYNYNNQQVSRILLNRGWKKEEVDKLMKK